MSAAHAQNTNVNGNNANSSSSTSSNSSSTSGSASNNAGNAQNITFNSAAPPSTTTANINSNSRQSGYVTGDQIVRTTPTVYAPPVSGGNPCTLAVSGGVSVIGWGASAGGTFVDHDCAERQKIAMIHNAGYQAVAKELMCNDRDTYNAFKTAGAACAFRQQFEAAPVAGAPPRMVQTAPPPAVVPAAAPVPAAPPAPPRRCNPRAGIVDNCYSG